MLSMKEKKRLIETIKDTNNDKEVLKQWIAEEKAKMVYDSDIAYATGKGRRAGIKVRMKGLFTSPFIIIT